MVIENLSHKSIEKILIHGIHYQDYPERLDPTISEALQGLIKENHYYEQNRFVVNAHLETLNLEAVGGNKVALIETLFNWKKLVMDYKGFDLFEVW